MPASLQPPLLGILLAACYANVAYVNAKGGGGRVRVSGSGGSGGSKCHNKEYVSCRAPSSMFQTDHDNPSSGKQIKCPISPMSLFLMVGVPRT